MRYWMFNSKKVIIAYVEIIRRRELVCHPKPLLLVFGRDEHFLSWGPKWGKLSFEFYPWSWLGWITEEMRFELFFPGRKPCFFFFAHSIHSETIIGIVISILTIICHCQETQVQEPPFDLSSTHGWDLSSLSSLMDGSISQWF